MKRYFLSILLVSSFQGAFAQTPIPPPKPKFNVPGLVKPDTVEEQSFLMGKRKRRQEEERRQAEAAAAAAQAAAAAAQAERDRAAAAAAQAERARAAAAEWERLHPINERITLFDGANFAGGSQVLILGNHHLVNYDNLLSSIKIPSGLTVTLYEHGDANGGFGKSKVLTADCNDLNVCSFDNITTYVNVQKKQGLTFKIKPAAEPLPTSKNGYEWATDPKTGKKFWRKAATKQQNLAIDEAAFAQESTFHDAFAQKPNFTDPFGLTPVRGAIKSWFKEEDAPLAAVEQTSGQSIHFFKNLYLKSALKIAGNNSTTILVADTIYIGSDASLEMDGNGIAHLKWVANHIYYERPLRLRLSSNVHAADGVFVFSANHIKYKQQGQNTCCLPYFFDRPAPNVRGVATVNWYKPAGEAEKLLQNERMVLLMEYNLLQIAAAKDVWKKDACIKNYLACRQQFDESDNNPPRVKSKFLSISTQYAALTHGNLLENRELTLASGKKVTVLVEKTNDKMIYSLLPTRAKVLPLEQTGKSLWGMLKYKATGVDKMKLYMDFQLTPDPDAYKEAQQFLKSKYDIQLDMEISNALILEQQAFKLNGVSTKGKILPLNSRFLRLEIDLSEEGKTIAEIIPKVNLTKNFGLILKNLNRNITLLLDYDKALLAGLDYTKPAQTFDIQNVEPLAGVISLENVIYSGVDGALGVLDYVEVKVELLFDTETVTKGIYRLSSYNTLASKTNIHFFKKSNNYKIRISGKVLYDKGNNMNTLKTFTTTDAIIIIDESRLATTPE
ncbi:MAG: hypothetical protein RLZZ628_3632 [Bacteroidota bacterium]|jgi:hypothetical protein